MHFQAPAVWKSSDCGDCTLTELAHLCSSSSERCCYSARCCDACVRLDCTTCKRRTITPQDLHCGLLLHFSRCAAELDRVCLRVYLAWTHGLGDKLGRAEGRMAGWAWMRVKDGKESAVHRMQWQGMMWRVCTHRYGWCAPAWGGTEEWKRFCIYVCRYLASGGRSCCVDMAA